MVESVGIFAVERLLPRISAANYEEDTNLQTVSLDFARLFREHYAQVYRYVRFRIDNDQIAEDLTSEIFERAFRYRNTFQPRRGAFSTWIGQIAQNWVNNYVSSQQHRMSQQVVEHEELEHIATTGPSPEAYVIGQEALRHLRACLERLSQRDREVVILRFGMNTRNKQIAEIMNLKEHTVSVIIMRALEALRGCQEAH